MQAANHVARDTSPNVPWNKGKLLGSRPPLQTRQVWAIRTKLQLEHRLRDLALFNPAIDSKLRGCDLARLKVEDIVPHGFAIERATVRQRKTGHPVRFELTEQTREAIDAYMRRFGRKPGRFLLASRHDGSRCISTRQYAAPAYALDRKYRIEPEDLWDPFATADEGCSHLSPYGKPASRPTAARSHQDRERPCAIAELTSTTRWRSQSKWMSEVPEQSRHALLGLLRPPRARS
jgi:integrase